MMRWIALWVIACGFLTPATLPAQGKWTREVRAPTPRTEVAVAVRGGLRRTAQQPAQNPVLGLPCVPAERLQAGHHFVGNH